MGRKVFVSYKYGDTQVQSLGLGLLTITKVRDYVTELQGLLEDNDELNKGEDDGVDLSEFKDDTIASKLRDKIYDSSITIAVISKGMKDTGKTEQDQWIPWEVSYSLRESTRNDRTSRSNAILAVVLPDETGRYDYYLVNESCPYCKCRTLRTDTLFSILRQNMFNMKNPVYSDCQHHNTNSPVYTGDYSYIDSVTWSMFKADVNKYLDNAVRINDKISEYKIIKTVD